jgi:hypothetical protein
VKEQTMTKDKNIGVRRSLYLPEDMARQLTKIALRERRSFNQQVVLFVEQAMLKAEQDKPDKASGKKD